MVTVQWEDFYARLNAKEFGLFLASLQTSAAHAKVTEWLLLQTTHVSEQALETLHEQLIQVIWQPLK